MNIIKLSSNSMLIDDTGLGLMYIPNGLVRDTKRSRWTIVLNGITVEFKDHPGMLGVLNSLSDVYIYVMENGENKHLPNLSDKFTPFGIKGIYRRGGLDPRYLVRVYGEVHQIAIGKTEKNESIKAMRLHDKLQKHTPSELINSLKKLSAFV